MSINHVCVSKFIFLLTSRLLVIMYFAQLYQNHFMLFVAVLILPYVPAGVAYHKEIVAIVVNE